MDNEKSLAGQQEPLPIYCDNCSNQTDYNKRYCRHCGAAINTIAEKSNEEKWISIKQAGLFFLLHAVACCIFSFVDIFNTISWKIAFDCFLAIVSIAFFALNWSELKNLLNWSCFSISKLSAFCIIAIVGSIGVSLIVRWINLELYSRTFSYYNFYLPHKHSISLAIFFTAVMPALFEELGYRGFLLGKLLQVTDTKQSIFISSFVFAIMHRSFISLFWLIPFALLIARIRIKEKTLWYGICIHFCFNFTATLLDILQYQHH